MEALRGPLGSGSPHRAAWSYPVAVSMSESDPVAEILRIVRARDPDRDLTVKEFALRLRRFSHHVETEIRRRLAASGMELWELEILATLDGRGGIQTTGQLSRSAQLTAAATTNRVSRLEAAGHVDRLTNELDRREVRVAITSSGKERLAEVLKANDAAEAEVLGPLPSGVLTDATRALFDLTNALSAD